MVGRSDSAGAASRNRTFLTRFRLGSGVALCPRNRSHLKHHSTGSPSGTSALAGGSKCRLGPSRIRCARLDRDVGIAICPASDDRRGRCLDGNCRYLNPASRLHVRSRTQPIHRDSRPFIEPSEGLSRPRLIYRTCNSQRRSRRGLGLAPGEAQRFSQAQHTEICPFSVLIPGKAAGGGLPVHFAGPHFSDTLSVGPNW